MSNRSQRSAETEDNKGDKFKSALYGIPFALFISNEHSILNINAPM